MALITLTELKNHIGIAAADTGADDALNQIIAGVGAAVVNFLRWDPEANTEQTRNYDGDGGSLMDLGVKNLTAVSEVKIGQDAATQQVVDSSWYRFEANGLLKMVESERYSARLRGYGYRFPIGTQNITVTFTAGYATVPADLKLAVIRWCGVIFNRRKTEGMSNVGDTANNTQTTTPFVMPPDIREMLKPYVKTRMSVI